MAHAVHPNYSGQYDSTHKPQINKGPVIKINANQRYSTNSPGMVEEAAKISKTPLQLFVVRNDSSCGSTIGPAHVSLLGTRTLDLGNPQLSMHSIRETGVLRMLSMPVLCSRRTSITTRSLKNPLLLTELLLGVDFRIV
ncbi:aminopeptidase I zinc metalloprotease-domain-containing protein [Lipomyces tetrasporus]|uniref:aspartyl aminopeptidase n=1 Tax=Lipomyces tetrasporus TaxID=54092 RepID=A0AAD7VQS3_9ASCO|nr:aminopeptidase I zinc metalloprotease-domain-containing protein [Lipomyces tetrasporus]KAJ8098438.1 aminopeptidase I zinc metalloprotease-domain-containing protein [Lipomyces tetrasporus]